MKSPIVFVGAAIALIGVWWAWTGKVSAAPPSACEEGPVPIAWPLGPTGFESRRLLSSHGQFQRFKTDTGAEGTPTVHMGIDIAACEDDVVYAVEDGVVEKLEYYPSGSSSSLRIADLDDEDHGWYYLHLKTITVAKGDIVLRDQAIGTAAAFSHYAGFDHLHLERVKAPADESLEFYMSGADDPLAHLTARDDAIPPRTIPFGTPIADDVRFLFFEDIGEEESLDHLPLADVPGKQVDVVARLSELFPGPGPTTCATSPCKAVEIADGLMPRRISFSILKEEDYTTSSGETATRLKRLFHNVIDLSVSIAGDAEVGALTAAIYRRDSVGNYEEREFLVVLTHCQVDGTGSYKFESGDYVLQLVLEDASGNASFLERKRSFP